MVNGWGVKRCIWTVGLAAALAVGCGSKADSDSGSQTESSTGDTGTTGGDDNSNTSNMSGTGESGADTMADGGFVNPETGSADSGPGDPQPDGADCTSNDGCESGFCFIFPMLGGRCSECLIDQDCGTGTCSFEPATGYALCTDGSVGKGCNTDEGCMGDLVCGELIDTGGVFNANFCSECATNEQCSGDDACVPQYNISTFTGQLVCAGPGTVANDEGCPVVGGVPDGSVCIGGHCGVAELFGGFLRLGVCGDCTADTDCTDGQTCTAASGSMSGLNGSSCG